MNELLSVELCVSVLVTVTLTVPAACKEVVQTICVELKLVTAQLDPPNETVAPVWKLLPDSVIELLPAVPPMAGEIPTKVGPEVNV